MMEILGKTSIDFMGWRRYSFAISGFFVLLGVVSLFQIWRGSANHAIDFALAPPDQFHEHLPI